MAVEVTFLGPPRIVRDGEPCQPETRKATALLATLALGQGPRSRESLCTLLWPRQDAERARGALRRTLSALRGSIGEEWIATPGDAVELKYGPGLQLDVWRFRDLASKDDSPPALAEAAETFPGEFLEGFALRDSPEFDSWQEREAAILRRELSAVLGRLVESLIQRGEFGDALSHTERWLELDRLQEPAHRALIRLYAWTGEREAALAQYRSCVRVLGQELGVAPLAETTDLFEQVSEGTLTGPHRPVATRPTPAATRPEAVELPLVGRTTELERLVGLHRGCSDQGTLCIVEGEAGIGKSRLCAELLAAVERSGGGVLSARCWEDEAGLPYGPVAELLNEATRSAPSWASAATPRQLADASVLQPELAALRSDVPDPMPLSVPGAQVRLMDAVAGIIGLAAGGSTPGVVFVDDLHAADEATLDVLGYMARRLAGQRLMLLLAWRTEAVPPGHRLRRMVAELGGRGGAESVRLRRLEQPEVAELVKAAAPQASPALLERAFAESEGLPLFVNELVAATLSGEAQSPRPGGGRQGTCSSNVWPQ